MSHDVLGVFYRHADDGKLYAHAFGSDVEVMLGTGRAGFRVVGQGIPRSGIRMTALGDKVIVLESETGHNLSEDF